MRNLSRGCCPTHHDQPIVKSVPTDIGAAQTCLSTSITTDCALVNNTLLSPNLKPIEPLPSSVPVLNDELSQTSVLAPQNESPGKISKQALRTSLKASTIDGVFAAVFSNITGGVLLINFLIQLGASPFEIGLLSSFPMLANFLQPVGAYFADRTTSRHWYVLAIFGPSRLLWLILIAGIAWFSWPNTNSHQLVIWTLAIILTSNILGALGSSAWFSWMAALVPHRLRGRYFGLRNSAASLTNLLSVPLLGLAISTWPSGPIQGYGVLLLVGVIIGIVSLGCQFWMTDVNPQVPAVRGGHREKEQSLDNQVDNQDGDSSLFPSSPASILKDTNFLNFLLYFGLWTFAFNLSSPFFNLYMLNNLALDLNWVTLYSSLLAGANLVMLILWGKLADRVGNRPLLLLVGTLMAVSPLFWLGTGVDSLSVWLWIPLIHVMTGGFGAALDLCNSNIQMEVAPLERPSQYFAIAAAVAGVSGGLGAAAGGFLAQADFIGGLPGLFALSAVVRLIALLPLVFVREPRSQSVAQIVENLLSFKPEPAEVATVEIVNLAE